MKGGGEGSGCATEALVMDKDNMGGDESLKAWHAPLSHSVLVLVGWGYLVHPCELRKKIRLTFLT